MKDAARHLDRSRASYPCARIALGFLESDSRDGTYTAIAARLPALQTRYRRVGLWKRDYDFRIPERYTRWSPAFQIPRRTMPAKSRNQLLFRALDEEDWVLWLDVDLEDYPADILLRLLATGKEIVQPHCVICYGGHTFDYNAWRDHGRLHLEDLRGEGELVRLDAVGGTMLLVKADVHRDGLIFPAYPHGDRNPAVRDPSPWSGNIVGELETEGLGIMAADMGYQCWGMPLLEIKHRNE
jgi:hypothetical protein